MVDHGEVRRSRSEDRADGLREVDEQQVPGLVTRHRRDVLGDGAATLERRSSGVAGRGTSHGRLRDRVVGDRADGGREPEVGVQVRLTTEGEGRHLAVHVVHDGRAREVELDAVHGQRPVGDVLHLGLDHARTGHEADDDLIAPEGVVGDVLGRGDDRHLRCPRVGGRHGAPFGGDAGETDDPDLMARGDALVEDDRDVVTRGEHGLGDLPARGLDGARRDPGGETRRRQDQRLAIGVLVEVLDHGADHDHPAVRRFGRGGASGCEAEGEGEGAATQRARGLDQGCFHGDTGARAGRSSGCVGSSSRSRAGRRADAGRFTRSIGVPDPQL